MPENVQGRHYLVRTYSSGGIATTDHFDLIVIGAGINGAGIARDAAMRGLNVLLIDKDDVGGGTSAWSTRLIHGGLRYLEHREFGLVRESLRERETLLKIAPHLVKPLPLIVPIYENSRRGRLTIRAGLLLYDLLSVGKTLPRHQILSPQAVLQTVPSLKADGLKGAALYFDGQVEFAERLVLENVIAAVEAGAKLMTYTRVDGFEMADNAIQRVSFTNLLTGVSGTAHAETIVNAAGPWVDEVLRNGPDSERLIGGTKGSHIVVARFEGAPETAIYVEASADKRPFFIIPWNDKYLIGTTDIRFTGDPGNVRITDAEVEYLLDETNRVLPSANLKPSDVLFSYSGVRPLAYTRNEFEASITRRHFIRRHPRLKNLLSIVGGKLTTYRTLAEEAVDVIVHQMRRQVSACTTANVSLPGAMPKGFEEIFKQSGVFDDRTNDRLMRIYGARSIQISDLVVADRILAEPFDDETGAIAAEVVYAFKNEYAQTLTDCLMRRTMVGFNSTCGLTAVEKAAVIARRYLGWTSERVEKEVRSYQKYVQRLHS